MGVGRPQDIPSGTRPSANGSPRNGGARGRRPGGLDQARPLARDDRPGPVALKGGLGLSRDANWPFVIVISTIAVEAATIAQLDPRIRAPIVLWFCLLCTGMAWIRLLRLEILPEFVLAVALSVALSGLVSSLFVYTGHWSPGGSMLVLQIGTLIGVQIDRTVHGTD